MNCVSRSQQRSCPAAPYMVDHVPNGVDVERLSIGECSKGSYAVALGRVCPEKGFHLALTAARRARMPLLLAGQVFPYEVHLRYFNQQIVPRLDRERRFIGPVRFSRKRSLLSRARCLLITSSVAETSSLVAMEALACGTPVVAFRTGALPEIVEHGKTGFIVDTVDEMAAALRAVESLEPENCRAAARMQFSSHVMGARYFHLYEQLIASKASGHLIQAPESGRLWAVTS